MELDELHISSTTYMILIIIFICFVIVFVKLIFFSKRLHKRTHLHDDNVHDNVLYVHQPYTYNETTQVNNKQIPKNDIVNNIQNMKTISNINLNVPTVGVNCNITKDCSNGLVCANNLCKRVIPTYPYKILSYDNTIVPGTQNNSTTIISNYNTSSLGQQCGGIIKNLPGNICNNSGSSSGSKGDLVCVSTSLLNTASGTCELVR